VTSRRCQRPATRSFHGLCFPSKVYTRLAPNPVMPYRRALFCEPKPASEHPWPFPRAGKPSRRPSRWNPFVRSPSSSAAEATGEPDSAGGRSRVPRGAFSTPGGSPLLRPDPHPRPKPRLVIETVLPKSVRSSWSWFAGLRCPLASDIHPRAGAFHRAAPKGSPLTFMRFVNVKERSEEHPPRLGRVSAR
jgi:hypothetical protein